MGMMTELRKVICRVAQRFGYELILRELLYDWQRDWERADKASHTDISLPQGAEEYLTTNNPRLQTLKEFYSKADALVTTPVVWNDSNFSAEDLKYFRGDNAYVYQVRNLGEVNYVVTGLYVKTKDTLGLLEKLTEDGAFGAHTFEVDGKVVSRDLLDSVLEINFLNQHLELSRQSVTILDIGAGYGRLAHRMAGSFPSVRYICTDAVPVSTFVCEYYLKYRGVGDQVSVVPLSELASLDDVHIDMAINIHSFSECTTAAIEWWVRWLRTRNVKLVLIIPNVRGPMTNAREEFGSILERHGYRQILEEPKFLDPIVSAYAVHPGWRYLYELQPGGFHK
jgi:hypothetical protein